MNWPVGKRPSEKTYHYDFLQIWLVMAALPKTDRVRNISASNFSPMQIEHFKQHINIKHTVHQIRLHSSLSQDKWAKWHNAYGIEFITNSPLGNMNPTYNNKGQRERTYHCC
ncbi:uncharacterized protein BDR25DRAFT_375124 [Lindgomyces ingoldianus]|uniref:Uncharacterized protein n=1 Tax=Lindgomyces ingoldianus TaxID=673940 RepID=A0ACB6RAL4_9PLEO|nr:uncharacterized protein BDR25DRAFT_375124 [Lindgomyces ingoldianus]KAF2476274.1 hypothetical protein BDR25DRAFT_375124 [Lindgomyces ingoldianus]